MTANEQLKLDLKKARRVVLKLIRENREWLKEMAKVTNEQPEQQAWRWWTEVWDWKDVSDAGVMLLGGDRRLNTGYEIADYLNALEADNRRLRAALEEAMGLLRKYGRTIEGYDFETLDEIEPEVESWLEKQDALQQPVAGETE